MAWQVLSTCCASQATGLGLSSRTCPVGPAARAGRAAVHTPPPGGFGDNRPAIHLLLCEPPGRGEAEGGRASGQASDQPHEAER